MTAINWFLLWSVFGVGVYLFVFWIGVAYITLMALKGLGWL